MTPSTVCQTILLALALVITTVSPSAAQDPNKAFGEALRKALDDSNYAQKRLQARLPDVSDEGFEGFSLGRPRAEWKRLLSPEVYRATQEKHAAGNGGGAHLAEHSRALHCAACGALLFRTESATDWDHDRPRFAEPAEPGAVVTDIHSEWSRETGQIELLCGGCGSHVGHVHPGVSADDALTFVANPLSLDLPEDPDGAADSR